jgi:hypothetical protein
MALYAVNNFYVLFIFRCIIIEHCVPPETFKYGIIKLGGSLGRCRFVFLCYHLSACPAEFFGFCN